MDGRGKRSMEQQQEQEQKDAKKRLSQMERTERAKLKKKRTKRMMEIEAALHTFGYWKGNLLQMGKDSGDGAKFDVGRWKAIVDEIAPERWDSLFQVITAMRLRGKKTECDAC